MNLEHLCMGCMRDKGPAEYCEQCGWREGTAPDSPLQLAARTILKDKYLLGRVLGQGGFGITYLAWDRLLDRSWRSRSIFPEKFAPGAGIRERCNREASGAVKTLTTD